LFLGSAKIAESSPGPGTVLPQLVHGGPGRAGGGEELGGLRGLAFYSQRVALEGSRPVIERIAGLGN
jgi:oxepin-CoA hydrolase/3-oxo-5,6-dehydrosuberyl-CoA semialdehyde dehydrogenase